ncbi:VNG_1110C family protein [Natrialba aegyptia]|uniref:Uncharacterized protein n=1 Tax=Natrialba aegyptia DSM 13077 TaxID=1227491 RepID=M0AYL1_9EURY|nr:hypothetical protein [Natrialba aegyptia]ELZ03786.1 hypothetical protein C480_15515 [Natrialba aegyptia DSM 13077]
MSDPSQLRESTQIVLPRETLENLEPRLDDEFVVTIVPEGERYYRIIGSPVEIKGASEFLVRRGVSMP